jgi:hypothetical protein
VELPTLAPERYQRTAPGVVLADRGQRSGLDIGRLQVDEADAPGLGELVEQEGEGDAAAPDHRRLQRDVQAGGHRAGPIELRVVDDVEIVQEQRPELVCRDAHPGPGPLDVAVLAEVAEHHDRDVASRGIVLQPAQNLEALDLRHDDVQQDEIRRRRAGQRERLLAVGGDHHGEAALPERGFGRPADEPIVFDEKHRGAVLIMQVAPEGDGEGRALSSLREFRRGSLCLESRVSCQVIIRAGITDIRAPTLRGPRSRGG